MNNNILNVIIIDDIKVLQYIFINNYLYIKNVIYIQDIILKIHVNIL